MLQGVLVGEKSHQPVSDARLALVDDSGHVAAADTTESPSGAFYLGPTKPGRYRLKILVGRGGLAYSPAFTLDSNQVVERQFLTPEFSLKVLEAYLPDDVTRPAELASENRENWNYSPRFPPAMWAARRSGVVRVTFVVDTSGHADMSTLSVISSDDIAFTKELRRVVEHWYFTPAMLNGVAVPQVCELGIDFGFEGEPPRLGRRSGPTGALPIMVRATPPH